MKCINIYLTNEDNGYEEGMDIETLDNYDVAMIVIENDYISKIKALFPFWISYWSNKNDTSKNALISQIGERLLAEKNINLDTDIKNMYSIFDSFVDLFKKLYPESKVDILNVDDNIVFTVSALP